MVESFSDEHIKTALRNAWHDFFKDTTEITPQSPSLFKQWLRTTYHCNVQLSYLEFLSAPHRTLFLLKYQ